MTDIKTTRRKASKKPELSPTRIRTFLTCPTMYRLDYIDKVGKFYHRAQAGYAFGTSLHQALQDFHTEGGPVHVSPKELKERLDTSWISAGYASAEIEQAHRETASQILENYHTASMERVDVTQTFLTEKMLKYDMGPFILTGRIDRIDEHLADGALEIIDYKSGRRFVIEEDVRQSIAMSIYQLLAKRLYPERRVFATIHALMTGATASTSYTDDELAELEDDIRGIGIMIIEKDFEAVKPIPLPRICPDCDFLRLCKRHWIKERIDFNEVLGI